MYEYKVVLPYKVDCCAVCPFRREFIIYENIQSLDKISGVCQIQRKNSHCLITDKPITININVDAYDSDCPLKNNIKLTERLIK